MKYVFTNIIGNFILDEKGVVLEKNEFKGLEDYSNREKLEQKLVKKHPQAQRLPQEKILLILKLLRDKSYFSKFKEINTLLTKRDLKASVQEDNLISQAISNLNEIDKIVNIFSKRTREWYALYCPEIVEKIDDQEAFAELIFSKSKAELLKEFKIDPKTSMGADLAKFHVEEIIEVAKEISQMFELRKKHEQYLEKVMSSYCPNLLELAGATIGAKLIELGKGLKHLAMLPASTIQLLGAEKALFRHIKTGSRSPKYGIIINHPFIQNAPKDKKGKASRMLADKLSLCARLDYFKGEFKAKEFRKELEERLK